MLLVATPIADLFVIEPKVFNDHRGYFYESYKEAFFKQNHLQYNWVQENEAKSTYGVVRGLHLQTGDYAQAKLIKVVYGEILDVVVDVRTNSSTYGQVFTCAISETNKKQLLIPRGFAHGYSVLSQEAVIQYKVDNTYNKEAESGYHVNSPALAINWGVPVQDMILSEKDINLPFFAK
jgi:dTDP-4-dehydrorhamnose 3,5-epimerase